MSGQGLRLVDLNGDTIPDVVAVCAAEDGARVFLGRGDGTFLPEQVFPGGGIGLYGVAAADWNCDGLADLALTGSNRQLTVLMNNTAR